MAADLARQGAQFTEQAASWFDGRDPGAVLNEVRSFARSRPGAFLLMAAGAGLLAGRLTRGLKDQAGGGSDPGQHAAGPATSELTTGAAGLTTGAATLGLPEADGLTTGLPEGGLTTGLPGAGRANGGGYPL
jgi:hypothetical protein